MAVPSFDMEMPSYIIYRDVQPGQPLGMAPLAFYPPKDSDELFDALRAKYPLSKTHSERMCEATLEFLREENTEDFSLPQPQQQQQPSMLSSVASSSQSTWSSPETYNLPTPNFGDSPRPLSRQFSVATTATVPSESR